MRVLLLARFRVAVFHTESWTSLLELPSVKHTKCLTSSAAWSEACPFSNSSWQVPGSSIVDHRKKETNLLRNIICLRMTLSYKSLAGCSSIYHFYLISGGNSWASPLFLECSSGTTHGDRYFES